MIKLPWLSSNCIKTIPLWSYGVYIPESYEGMNFLSKKWHVDSNQSNTICDVTMII